MKLARPAALAVVPFVALLSACGPADAEIRGDEEFQTLAACLKDVVCDATPPDPGPASGWRHWSSKFVAASGSPNHRGRDQILRKGDPQWVIAKLAYGVQDKDLEDEDVDVWLERGCGDSWEKLGTARTTDDDTAHPTVEGIADKGGRVYFEIPAKAKLGIGRHRIHLVARGDLSSTDLFIEVLAKNTKVFVSDVDGTLTTNEVAEFGDLLVGKLPETHEDAPEVLTELAAKGYRPIYLTARPESLVQRTRDFVEARGFPPGTVHTTTSLTPAMGSAAATFKTKELAAFAARGYVPSWAFGNTATDSQAYEADAIKLERRVFYRFDDERGGRRIDHYGELLDEVDALPDVCK